MRKAVRQVTKASLKTTSVRDVSTTGSESGREMMQAVLARPRQPGSAESSEINLISGIVIGTLSDPAEDGRPMVYFPGIPGDKPLAAISTDNLSEHETGHEVALGFVGGDPTLPIILGLIQKTGLQEQPGQTETTVDQSVNVQLDGDRLTLSAEHEIVLKCGKSSITLTRAGKVVLKGAYLSTHSTGVNRIKGGSVQIN